MVLDESNPRALIYQIERLHRHIGVLPAVEQQQGLSRAGRLTLEALTALRLSRLDELAARDASGAIGLAPLLSRFDLLLHSLADVLAECYFDHRVEQRQLVQGDWGYG